MAEPSSARRRPAPRMGLPSRVLECFAVPESMPDGAVSIGLCALGYDGPHRVFDDRRSILVRDVGGRGELGILKAVAWAAGNWSGAEAVVVHLPNEYLARRLEALISGEEAVPLSIEVAEGVVADRIERPTTPRMDEATALSKQGRHGLVIE